MSFPDLRIGHWSDTTAHTGCTVVLPPAGSRGAVFVAGGAPATRETNLLEPGFKIDEVHAVLLTGGSAFGLSAAQGVMRWLEERDTGYRTPVATVPIVPAAALYDLWPGDASVRPGPDAGYAACDAATEAAPAEGNAGVGTGATVGKTGGPMHATKGGVGWAALEEGDLVVACLAAVNAVGDILREDGQVVAGARGPSLGWDPSAWPGAESWPPPSTTLACVITNADLPKDHLHRVARMASAGLARAIRPVYTMFDGDVVFALATRTVGSVVDQVGALAADATAAAVRRGVLAATSIDGVPACTAPDGAPYGR
jgi:L-aminopeptidase/D-esterase-like protein